MTTLSQAKEPFAAATEMNTCGVCRVNRLPPPCPGHILPDECGGDESDDEFQCRGNSILVDEITNIHHK